MARREGTALTRIEVLLLSSVARMPMSGYDMKLELRYKHVRWWAKVEHGHLYAALQRLERRGDIRAVAGSAGPRGRRAFKITPTGSKRLHAALIELGGASDATHFDVDLFLQGMFVLDRAEVLASLAKRREALVSQQAEAQALVEKVASFVPLAARLIMDHRLSHIRREIEFTDRATEAVHASEAWGSFLRGEPISQFVKRTGVPLEGEGGGAPAKARARGAAPKKR